jgi:DNA polymerase III epsilon subunit-like protein
MKAPIKQMNKTEVEWLGTHECKHKHSYLEHYECYLRDAPQDSPFVERIGIFDIETTGLKADYHYVIAYAIRDDGDDKLYGRVLTPDEIKKGVFDRELLKEMCEDLLRFHRIVVHYGSDYKFDLPFVRSRSVKYGYDFPLYKDIYVMDTQSILKAKFCLSSNRLASACTHFGIEAKQHPITPDLWQAAGIGEKKALDYIWTHNIEDVDSTRILYHKIVPYTVKGKRSI